MKKINLVGMSIALMGLSNVAFGLQQYQCEASLPKAVVLLSIEESEGGLESVYLTFENAQLNEVYKGKLDVTWHNPSTGQLIASGFVSGDPEIPQVVLQGNLKPNAKGEVRFSLGAGWDHRIEYGYGNLMVCERVR